MKTQLDKTCEKLLTIMIVEKVVEEHPKRFNELFRMVNNYYQKKGISKPSFQDHIEHLLKLDFVIREQIEKQKVIYYLNMKNQMIFNASKTLGFITQLDNNLKEKLNKKPIDDIDLLKWFSEASCWFYLKKTYSLLKSSLEESPESIFNDSIAYKISDLWLTNISLKMFESFYDAKKENRGELEKVLNGLEDILNCKREEILKISIK